MISIFTDGSCMLHDNGRGGYGALLIYENSEEEIYGGYKYTTNNRMELLAVIEALDHIKTPSRITVYSDSRYVTEAVNKKWLFNWVRKDFNGIKNPDLWKRLLPLLDKHDVIFTWVKAHNNGKCLGNERADELATIGASMDVLIPDNRFT